MSWRKISIVYDSEFETNRRESTGFLPVVHEYFDESIGQVVRGRAHIRQICKEKGKRYLSVDESNQEYIRIQKEISKQKDRRNEQFAHNFVNAYIR